MPSAITVVPVHEDAAVRDAMRERCRVLVGHRSDALPRGSSPYAVDVYGDGGVVSELEAEVAGLLGAESAAFFPTGTAAQQAAVRTWCDETARRVAVMHPLAHPLAWEDDGLRLLHRLEVREVGDPQTTVLPEHLTDLADVGTVLVELPQRETGGWLVTDEHLGEMRALVDAAGARLHLDGARLWECAAALGRIDLCRDVAHSAYVSFYKGLGADAGAVLAGPAAFVAEAKRWRHRHGARPFRMSPYAGPALDALRWGLPQMPAWTAHAVAIGTALGELDGVRLRAPVQTPLMHLVLDCGAAEGALGLRRLADEHSLWLGGGARQLADGRAAVEVSLYSATEDVTVAEMVDAVALLVTLCD